MANENEDQGTQGSQNELGRKDDSTRQQQPESGEQGSLGGSQGQQSEFGQQSGESTTGSQAGQDQSDRQSQGETSVADRTGQQSGSTDEGNKGGFIGSQEQEHDPQQAGFAEQGRGAPEEDSDIERGSERSQKGSSDIEGSSDR